VAKSGDTFREDFVYLALEAACDVKLHMKFHFL